MRSRLASRGGAGADDDDDAEAAAAAAPLKLLRPWRRCCCCCANLLLLLLLPLPLPLPLLTSPAVDHRLRCCRRGFEGSRGRDGTRRGYSKSCEASTALRPRCLTGQRGACTRRVPAQAKSRESRGAVQANRRPVATAGANPPPLWPPTLPLPPSHELRLVLAGICDLDDARRGQQMAITECGWSRSGRWVVSARCAPQRGTELVVCPSGTKRLDRARRRRPGTARRDGKITITGRGWGCWGQRIASARPVPGPSSPIRM